MPSCSIAKLIVSAVICALADATPANGNFDVLDYIDPLIGTANGGKKACWILVSDMFDSQL